MVVLGAGCNCNPPPQSNLEQNKPQVNEAQFNTLISLDGLFVIYPKDWSISENSTEKDWIFTHELPGSNSSIVLELFRATPPSPIGPTLSRGSDFITEEMPLPGMWLVYTSRIRNSEPSYAVWGMKYDHWSYLYSLEISGEPTEEEIKQTLVLFRSVIGEFVRVNKLT